MEDSCHRLCEAFHSPIPLGGPGCVGVGALSPAADLTAARSIEPALDALLDTSAVVQDVLNGIVNIKRSHRSALCTGRT